MGIKTALIQIDERRDEGYLISLSVDAGGDRWAPVLRAEGTAAIPEDPPEVLGGPLTPEVARRVLLEHNGESAEFRLVGEYLHRLVAASPIGDAWREFRDQTAADDVVRTLFDVRDADLRRVPWELIWDAQRPLGVFANSDRPCARVHDFRGDVEATEQWWPLLSVMVVVALDDEEADSELAGLHDGFAHVSGLVDLDIVRRPSEWDFKARYEKTAPHVLHFIGHGRSGQLDFPPPDDAEDGWSLDAASIEAILKPRPRLVVLNACRSADLNVQSGVWDVSETLIGLGVPAVVAMQGDVREDAAHVFSVELYRRLGRGVPIDVAVAFARSAMKAEVGSWHRRDPWLPSLTVAMPPESVLPRRYKLEKRRHDALRRTLGYEVATRFVDRSEQRRQLWRGIIEVSDGGHTTGVAVLGPERVGKTAFAQWCVGASQLRGHDAAYIDLDHRKHDSLGLLARIAEELCLESGDAPHVVDGFDAYIDQVDKLQGEKPPVNPRAPAEGRYRRKHRDVSVEVIDGIYAAFRAALKSIAETRRVLIALDRAPAVQDNHWGKYFVRHLLGRLDEANAACLITANDEHQLASILGAGLARSFTSVTLPLLDKREFGILLGQLMRAHRYRRQDFGPWVAHYVHLMPTAVPAGHLEMALILARGQSWTLEEQEP